jgi:hypothetical protein
MAALAVVEDLGVIENRVRELEPGLPFLPADQVVGRDDPAQAFDPALASASITGQILLGGLVLPEKLRRLADDCQLTFEFGDPAPRRTQLR